jgi:hypothetical protein
MGLAMDHAVRDYTGLDSELQMLSEKGQVKIHQLLACAQNNEDKRKFPTFLWREAL